MNLGIFVFQLSVAVQLSSARTQCTSSFCLFELRENTTTIKTKQTTNSARQLVKRAKPCLDWSIFGFFLHFQWMSSFVCTISGMSCQPDDQRDKGKKGAWQLPWLTSFLFRPLFIRWEWLPSIVCMTEWIMSSRPRRKNRVLGFIFFRGFRASTLCRLRLVATVWNIAQRRCLIYHQRSDDIIAHVKYWKKTINRYDRTKLLIIFVHNWEILRPPLGQFRVTHL